jgi:hypothetical protein
LINQGLEADEDALSQEVCSNPWTKSMDQGVVVSVKSAGPVVKNEILLGLLTTSTDWLVVRPGVFKPDLDRALRSIPTQGFFNKVPSGKNNVYVGHGVTFTQGVLSSDFGISEARIFLEEGEAAVFEPGDKPRVLGKIKFY